VRPIRFWQHWRAVNQIYQDYPPGADVLVDQIRSSGFLTRCVARFLLAPLYFAREQGWAVRGAHGELAAIMYLRRGARKGIRVVHVDELNVHAQFRGLGLAQRLLALAEEVARAEQRPFLKLAVTVANTPAVTLYRRLGYQEQHHRFFTFVSPSPALPRAYSTDIKRHRVTRGQAAKVFQQFYAQEVTDSTPEVAELLLAYYPQGADMVGVPLKGRQSYVFEQQGKPLGYGEVYQQRAHWRLRLSLRPDVWGTACEWNVLQMLTTALESEPGAVIALHVPSAAHFEALGSGAPSLASELGLRAQHARRMVMVKGVARAYPPRRVPESKEEH
jgi:ribosomal protein S18 acetylase RimI-like enzyme